MAKKKASKRKTPSQIRAADEKQWQARSDLQTLRQAEEIRVDKARTAAARTEAQKELKALNKITGGKKK